MKPENLAPDNLPQLTKTICAFIRSGGYPLVAAEAAGVPAEQFQHWLLLGSPKKGSRGRPSPFIDFATQVRQAIAQSRLAAEIKVHDSDPLAWLKQGPGKETRDAPGWSVAPKPQVIVDNKTVNVLLSPQLMTMFGLILEALSPFPEARAVVANTIAGAKTAKPALPKL